MFILIFRSAKIVFCWLGRKGPQGPMGHYEPRAAGGLKFGQCRHTGSSLEFSLSHRDNMSSYTSSQPLWSIPKVFSGQLNTLSFQWVPGPPWGLPKHLTRYFSQMPELLQLIPLSVEKQWLYAKLPPEDTALHFISKLLVFSLMIYTLWLHNTLFTSTDQSNAVITVDEAQTS